MLCGFRAGRVALQKTNTYTPCLPPYDPAFPLKVVGFDDQSKLTGNANDALDLQESAGFRNILDSSANGGPTIVENNRTGLKHARPPGRNTSIDHFNPSLETSRIYRD